MSKGAKRTGAEDSASGAAAAGTPPTRAAAAPAPPKRRGRKAKAALAQAKVGDLVELLELEQQKRELLAIAELARTLAKSNCGARDAAAALSVEARCRNKLIDLLLAEQQQGEVEDLKAQLADIQRRLAGKKGSALRADVAATPPPARGTRTVQ